MTPKELLIVGRGNGWKSAPHDIEAWGVRQLIGKRPLAKVFEMHLLENTIDDQRRSRKKAEEMGIPYYTADNYPLDKIIKYFKTDFFSNSLCYAIALAIYEGVEKVDLYGINQVNEGVYQKCGIDYWCGQVMGRGIGLTVNGRLSAVMKTKDRLPYGYLKKVL
jgi:hypothetical protein